MWQICWIAAPKRSGGPLKFLDCCFEMSVQCVPWLRLFVLGYRCSSVAWQCSPDPVCQTFSVCRGRSLESCAYVCVCVCVWMCVDVWLFLSAIDRLHNADDQQKKQKIRLHGKHYGTSTGSAKKRKATTQTRTQHLPYRAILFQRAASFYSSQIRIHSPLAVN